jgi:ABC-type sugar transport system ATPase subunit
MSFVEMLVSNDAREKQIEQLSKLGLTLVSERKSNSGIYLQFKIPEDIGFGSLNEKRQKR